jgi:predicted DNA-binding protein (MmcQ/YjbR family)
MTPAAFHEAALKLPSATYDVKWGVDRAYSVGGKMFAVSGPIEGPDPNYSFKASDMTFEVLIGEGIAVAPAYLARAKWVQIKPGALPDDQVRAYLAEAHRLVAAKLTRKKRAELGLPPVDGGR